MKNHNHITDACIIICSFLFLISFFIFPGITGNATRQAIRICALKLIPTLFPFIVTARIITEHFINVILSSEIKHRRFIKSVTVILSYISGYPCGAIICSEFYKSGLLSKNEAEAIISFSNTASPAFCIILFGKIILGSTTTGLVIFLNIIFLNLIFILFKKKINSDDEQFENQRNAFERKKEDIPKIIGDSFFNIMNICAFVIYFMCIGSLCSSIIRYFFDSQRLIEPIVLGIFEISGGVSMLADLSFVDQIISGSIIIGFGGLSALFQIASVCNSAGLSYKKYITCKIFCAILSPIVALFIIYILPDLHFFPLILFILILISAVKFLLYIIIKIKEYKKSKLFY